VSAPKTQPALVGGLVLGVLSALPIIAAGNLCCCLWVVAGGMTAAYVLQQNDPQPITAADGALAGFLAGIVGAIVYLMVSIPVTFFVSPMERRLLQRIAETAGNMPPEFRRYMDGSMAMASVRLVLGFVLMVFAGAVFSTLGGLLGAALFRKAVPHSNEPGAGSV
jgi:hypothetical protein